MPELGCKQRVNSLCSYLIWSEDQLRIEVCFFFVFVFGLCGLSFWVSFPFFPVVSRIISSPFCILVLECSPSCSLSHCALFLFLFGLFSLLLPGWYNAAVWVLKSPWSIGSSENTLKGHFIMFMKQHLRPSSNMTWWESSILNSLQTFVAPFALKCHFFFSLLWLSAF